MSPRLMIGPGSLKGTKRGFKQATSHHHVSGDVLSPGEAGFGGHASDGSRRAERGLKDWQDYHQAGKVGRRLVGVSGGLLTVGAGIGYADRSAYRRRNAELERKLGKVNKGWSRAEPYLWDAGKKKGVYGVTSMGAKSKPYGPVHTLGRRLVQGDIRAAAPLGVGLIGGTVAGAAIEHGESKRNYQLRRELQRKQRAARAARLAASRQVTKAQYGITERRRSSVRTAEMLAGGVLGAWGASRLKMIGPMADFGVRMARANGGGEAAARVVSLAHTLAREAKTATEPLSQLKRYKPLGDAIERVPSVLRPAVATTAGAILVDNAHPLHRDRFVPTGGQQ